MCGRVYMQGHAMIPKALVCPYILCNTTLSQYKVYTYGHAHTYTHTQCSNVQIALIIIMKMRLIGIIELLKYTSYNNTIIITKTGSAIATSSALLILLS